jgi:ADP-glucose pyrophosphorylase
MPSVPFNGRHRVVDFVLSNLVNSEIYSIHRVPGIANFEDPRCWRDVGTIEAYFDARFDTLGHIPSGEQIGIDLARDRQRSHVSETGVVVVPRSHFRKAVMKRSASERVTRVTDGGQA